MAVILFAGCAQSTTAPPIDREANSTDSTPQETQISETNVPAIELSQADSAAIVAAMDLNDASYCEKIVNIETKQRCLTTLKDSQVSSRALESKDSQICEELSNQDIIEACKIQVEVEQKLEANKVDFQESLYLSDEIGVSGNLQRCALEIKDPSVIAQCELNIIVNKALEEQKPELCEQASTEVTKEKCRQDYIVLTTPPPGGAGGPPPGGEEV